MLEITRIYQFFDCEQGALSAAVLTQQRRLSFSRLKRQHAKRRDHGGSAERDRANQAIIISADAALLGA